MIKLSVIVPAFNLENYIENSVASILAQTERELELIAVDDGSQDKTGEILDRLAAGDARMKVIHTENRGVTAARLTGVTAAAGAWIGFVDGDDFVEPDMFECLLRNAQESGADISHCGYRMVFPSRVDFYYNTGRKLIQSGAQGVEDLLEGSFVEPGLGIKLFRAEILREAFKRIDLAADIRINEDLLLSYYCFAQAQTAVYEDFCPYHYMVRKGSAATAPLSPHKLTDPYKVLKILQKETEAEPKLQAIVNRRLLAQLINLSILPGKNATAYVSEQRAAARAELRKSVPEVLRGSYSGKQRLQALWAAIWPGSYRLVHTLYAKLSGTGRKYEVN